MDRKVDFIKYFAYETSVADKTDFDSDETKSWMRRKAVSAYRLGDTIIITVPCQQDMIDLLDIVEYLIRQGFTRMAWIETEKA